MDYADRRTLAATRTEGERSRTAQLGYGATDNQVVTGLTVGSLRHLYNLALQASVREPAQQEAFQLVGVVLDRMQGESGLYERIARTEPYPVIEAITRTTPVPAG